MVIFNSYVKLPEGTWQFHDLNLTQKKPWWNVLDWFEKMSHAVEFILCEWQHVISLYSVYKNNNNNNNKNHNNNNIYIYIYMYTYIYTHIYVYNYIHILCGFTFVSIGNMFIFHGAGDPGMGRKGRRAEAFFSSWEPARSAGVVMHS